MFFVSSLHKRLVSMGVENRLLLVWMCREGTTDASANGLSDHTLSHARVGGVTRARMGVKSIPPINWSDPLLGRIKRTLRHVLNPKHFGKLVKNERVPDGCLTPQHRLPTGKRALSVSVAAPCIFSGPNSVLRKLTREELCSAFDLPLGVREVFSKSPVFLPTYQINFVGI